MKNDKIIYWLIFSFFYQFISCYIITNSFTTFINTLNTFNTLNTVNILNTNTEDWSTDIEKNITHFAAPKVGTGPLGTRFESQSSTPNDSTVVPGTNSGTIGASTVTEGTTTIEVTEGKGTTNTTGTPGKGANSTAIECTTKDITTVVPHTVTEEKIPNKIAAVTNSKESSTNIVETPGGIRKLNYIERKEIIKKINLKDNKLIKNIISKYKLTEIITNKKPKLKKLKQFEIKKLTNEINSFDEELESFGDIEPTQINHVKAGSFIYYKNEVYILISIQHIAQARAKGHYKVKMKLLHTNKENSFSFPDGAKLSIIIHNKISCIYSHFDINTNSYVFIRDGDSDSGSNGVGVSKGSGVVSKDSGMVSDGGVTGTSGMNIRINKNMNINALKYMKSGLKVSITMWKDKILNVFIPFHIEYKVVKINTGNYAATLDNGLTVLVPTYIKVNDHIEITTKAGEFLRRTKIS
uniref:Elongation factor P (EF-P) KOW-like domain/Elongation factor P, C-terminal, putative n=1 Tax=Theileria annulata TaxID=5874 RepID=A0A3B0MUG3_THEAN